MKGIAATQWSRDTQKRMDIFWLDSELNMSHVGWDGQGWIGNSPGPLGPDPSVPNRMGGVFTTVPVAVYSRAVPPPLGTMGAGLGGQASTSALDQSVGGPVRIDLQASALGSPSAAPPATVMSGARMATAAPASAEAPPLVTTTGPSGGPVGEQVAVPEAGVRHAGPGLLPQADRIDVFGLGQNYAMYHQVVWDGVPAVQPEWSPLGGDFISAPAAVAWNDGQVDGRLELFAVGSDRKMYHQIWNTTAWADAWEDLGGIFTSEASVVSSSPGRLDIFARSSDFSLRHRAYDGTSWMTDWESLGESLGSAPTAISWGPNRLDVFAIRRSDGSMIHTWWDGAIWSQWESLSLPPPPPPQPPVTFLSEPSVVSPGPGRLEAFVLGSDGILYHFSFQDGAWSTPEALGSVVVSVPTAVSLAPDELHLLGADSSGTILTSTWDGANWTRWAPLELAIGPNFSASLTHMTMPSRYRIAVENVKAATVRSKVEDTDTGACSATAGNAPTRMATEAMGDIIDGGNYQPVNMHFDDVDVDLCEHLLFNYQILNKGDNPPDLSGALQTATNDLVNYAIQSISKQLTSGVAVITSLEIASLGVPVAGPILGILAGWLTGEIQKIIKLGDCDGPVALEQYAISGRDLLNNTFNEPYRTTTAHSGTDAGLFCGPTSQYQVTWSITRVI